MKKILVLLLANLIMMINLSAIAENAAEAQAWDQVFVLVEEETEYSKHQLEKGQLVYESGVWVFSLLVKDHPNDEDGLLVGQMDDKGSLLSLHGPNKISLNQQLERDLKSCFNRVDCYLLLAAVREKWLPILQPLSTDQLDELIASYVSVIRLSIAIPNDNAIAYNDAYDAALQHLAQQPEWNDEQVGLFRMSMSAYYTPEDIGRPVYFFFFEQHSYMEDAYSTDQAMNNYIRDLEKAFNGEAPYRISIMVDAANGDLVELPIYDYAPVQYHYLDFLIRTDEIIQAGKGAP